jgi:ParB family chromosome partitioning protein
MFADDELQDLANSIREHGIVQPILVRPVTGVASVSYEIIAGERRWRAAQLAELHEVPVIIRQVADKQALEIAIIENVQRSDLNPIEEALGYQQMIGDHQYSQSDLAQVIGKSRSHVANTLRLLKLPENVRSMVSAGALSAGHARALITADDPEALAMRIVDEGLSVRQAEALMQAKPEPNSKNGKSQDAGEKDADTLALERSLSDLLGLKVAISFKKDGSGDLRIRYKSLEQLDDICRRLQH